MASIHQIPARQNNLRQSIAIQVVNNEWIDIHRFLGRCDFFTQNQLESRFTRLRFKSEMAGVNQFDCGNGIRSHRYPFHREVAFDYRPFLPNRIRQPGGEIKMTYAPLTRPVDIKSVVTKLNVIQPPASRCKVFNETGPLFATKDTSRAGGFEEEDAVREWLARAPPSQTKFFRVDRCNNPQFVG